MPKVMMMTHTNMRTSASLTVQFINQPSEHLYDTYYVPGTTQASQVVEMNETFSFFKGSWHHSGVGKLFAVKGQGSCGLLP